jgi:anaerobic ribonucleoside-triphosphate reductase
MDTTVLNNAERTKCEIWTRVMGYHRPINEYNIGKKAEYNERKEFVQDKIVNIREFGT